MADDLEIVGRIRVQDDGSAAIERFNSNVTKGTEAVGGMHQKVSLLGGLANSVGNAFSFAFGQVIFSAFSKVASVVGDFFGGIAEETGKFDEIMAQTDAVLKSTGGKAGVTREEVMKLGDAFSHTTKFSDDQIISAENLLLTFTNIGQDVFPQATTAVADMAQAMGEDLKTASIQVGKALQDPILGVGALRRVGVNFTDDQKKVIEQLVKTGQSAKAQAMILKELNTEFGGSAEAAGKTLPGQLAIAQHSMEDMQKTIGDGLEPAATALLGVFTNLMADPAITTGLQSIVGEVNNLAQAFVVGLQGGDPVQAVTNAFYALGGTAPIFNTLGDVVNSFVLGLKGFTLVGSDIEASPLMTVFNQIGQKVQEMGKVFSDSMPMIQKVVADMWAFTVKTFSTSGMAILKDVTDVLASVTAFWKAHGDEVMAVVSFLWKAVVTIISAALTVVGGVVKIALDLVFGLWAIFAAAFHGDWSKVWTEIQTLATKVWEDIKQATKDFFKVVLQAVGTNLADFKKMWKENWDMFTVIITTWFNDTKAKIIAWFNNIPTELQKLYQSWRSIGLNLMNAIKDGIFAKAAEITNAVVGSARDALDKVRNFLGIHSPSTVFMEIGGQMMQGMAAGINGMSNMPQLAMENAATGVTGAGAVASNNVNNFNTTYQLNASYATAQDPNSIRTDLEMMTLLKNPGAAKWAAL